MQWLAKAPSNIALIKYMGKKDSEANIPDNPSLSYTLPNLVSTVSLELSPGKQDFWEPLSIPGGQPFQLSAKGQERFLLHLARIKKALNFDGAFIVRSTNNFPHGSGLASSASSFAALTKAACLAIAELKKESPLSIEEQAFLSMQGSGSSCRSFFSPWALWEEKEVKAIDLPFKDLIHQVIIISHEEKKVSSSLAHKLVKDSSNYKGRSQRAIDNLKRLLDAFAVSDWHNAYQICWQEFQDMHHLFSSAKEPFSYITKESEDLLQKIQNFWQTKGDGPLVTMDAGPNIHLLYRANQKELADEFKQQYLVGNYDVL